MQLVGLIVFGVLLVGAIIYIKTRKKQKLSGGSDSVFLTEEEAAFMRTLYPDQPITTSIPVPIATRDYIRERMKA
jgi:hypothetical protein